MCSLKHASDFCAVNPTNWRRDEFAQQMIAGANPVCIKRVTSFPLTSKLDHNVFGDQDSKMTRDHVEKNLGGMTVQVRSRQVLKRGKVPELAISFLLKIEGADARAAEFASCGGGEAVHRGPSRLGDAVPEAHQRAPRRGGEGRDLAAEGVRRQNAPVLGT